MSAQGGPSASKSTGQLVGFSLVALSGVLGTTLAAQFGLSPWATALVALGITLPLAFVLLVVQNLFLKWAPASSDRIDRMLRRHRKRYLESLHEHVRHLEVLGVATQGEFTLKLGDVYVDVALTPKSAADSRVASVKRQSLTKVIENSESGVVAVIGGPGSGKTTLLRHQALSMYGQKRGRLPILLEIRQHASAIVGDAETSIADLAASSRAPKEWLEARLKARDCQVMLDGLDEVADEDDRRKVVQWLRGQVSSYPGNRFVITSRPYGYDENPLPNADRVEVQPFTDEQIERFLHAWYEAVERRSTGEDGPSSTDRARRSALMLLGRLQEHGPLLDFAANPLLLTMIALVHRYRGALPGTRAKLYAEMCAVLLHRRREAKGLATGDELSGEQKERVARTLARSMMEHGERDVRRHDAIEAIRPALINMRPVTSAADYLREAVRSGLLVEPREGLYAFAHLTLQEYLAAVDVRVSGDEESLFERIGSSWWRETILLWAADADVTRLVEACTYAGTVEAAVLATKCIAVGRELTEEVRRRFYVFIRAFDGNVRHRYALGMWLGGERVRTGLLGPVPQAHLKLLLDGDVPLGCGDHDEALGVPRSVAASLPGRLNELMPGARFRLPTVAELDQPGARHPGTSAVWAQHEKQPLLWCPPGVRHPFAPTAEELLALLSADGVAQDFRLTREPMIVFPEYLPLELATHIEGARFGGESMFAHFGPCAAIIAELAECTRHGLPALTRDRAQEARTLAVEGLSLVRTFRGVGSIGIYRVAEDILFRTLCALAVHELRSTGVIQPNEILVLARD